MNDGLRMKLLAFSAMRHVLLGVVRLGISVIEQEVDSRPRV
jgi:hypothetical protein